MSAAAQRGEEMAERRGHRPVGGQRLGGMLGNQGRVVELQAEQQRRDPGQDEQRVAAMAAAEADGLHGQTLHQGQQQPGQDEGAEDVLEVGDRGGEEGDGVEPHANDEGLDDGLGDGGEQDQEAPEDERVERARVGPAEQAALTHDIGEEGTRPSPEVPATRVGAAGLAHQVDEAAPPQPGEGERRAGQRHQRDGADDGDGHGSGRHRRGRGTPGLTGRATWAGASPGRR